MQKYAIHPGHVLSAFDGQVHYIEYHEIVCLYHVDSRLCFKWRSDEKGWKRRYGDYIHLYPRYDGNYSVDYKEDVIDAIKQEIQTGGRLNKER